MSDKKSVDQLAQLVSEKIDVLVNNAGTLTKAEVLQGAPCIAFLNVTACLSASEYADRPYNVFNPLKTLSHFSSSTA